MIPIKEWLKMIKKQQYKSPKLIIAQDPTDHNQFTNCLIYGTANSIVLGLVLRDIRISYLYELSTGQIPDVHDRNSHDMYEIDDFMFGTTVQDTKSRYKLTLSS